MHIDSIVTQRVIIIIPTYQEQDAIAKTIHAVYKERKSFLKYDLHVLVFDSASKDSTQIIVRALQKQYATLHLQCENIKTGLGSAYAQAMRYALDVLKADYIVEFDADLSHQPQYILPMIKLLDKYDVVVGSRYVRGGSIHANWSYYRRFISKIGNYVARIFITYKYKDLTSGFRATRRDVLNKVLPEQFASNGYAYKLHLMWLLHQSGASIQEYPIEFIDRTEGSSKLPSNTISDSLKTVMLLRYSKLRRYIQMCLIGGIGLIIQLILYKLLRHFYSPFRASQCAVLFAIINNYFLHQRFTFQIKQKLLNGFAYKKIINFILYSSIMVYFQSEFMQIGLLYLGHGALQENSLFFMGVILGSLLNYFIYSRFLFKQT